MTITLPIWRWIRSFLSAESTPTNTSEGRHLQILADPSEWKYAGAIAFVLFVASLLFAPALTRDHRKLASEINAKTLKAAATLKTSPTPSQH